ncbi:maleylpyruvate isomerase N-terminal domain-containing protein [Streptosporangiaceae bacterium NEAU-GS5]|nr:maleylpyruvate isomerase N-terminal domain-containing protein [Streptosporangiaceae bacterium NEAU-GS5]
METKTETLWPATREALARTGTRFAALVTSAPDPDAPVTREWSVMDTTAHVEIIASWYAHLLGRDDATAAAFDGADEQIAATTVDTVADLNRTMLGVFRDRDPAAVVAALTADIDDILTLSESQDPMAVVPWLGGSRLPIDGLLAHLINELLVHGWDVAKALGRPWPIPEADAALFFELFLIGVTRSGYGRLLDNDRPPRPGTIAVEFRSRHTTPITMVLRDGLVFVRDPEPGEDVVLTFRPPALNLMLFSRVGKLRTALTGGVRVSGRRPWLLPAFLRKVHLPS